MQNSIHEPLSVSMQEDNSANFKQTVQSELVYIYIQGGVLKQLISNVMATFQSVVS